MLKAVIFDLDGVIVSTDQYHFHAWSQMCNEFGITIDISVFEKLRGISRIESLNLILASQDQQFSLEEKELMLENKDCIYKKSLQKLTRAELLPGIFDLLMSLKGHNIALAIGSSSKNTETILEQLSITHLFDVIVSGNHITNSKPHPEVFLSAAKKLGLKEAECVVVEDAAAGIEAAKQAGMVVVGIGKDLTDSQPDLLVVSTEEVTVSKLINLITNP